MKLFTLGPVEMFPETFKIAAQQVPYFRTPEFSEIVFQCEKLLIKFAKAEKNAKTVLLTASGTAAMEAAVINCFSEKDKLLIVDGGSFGHRFTEICDIHKVPYDAIKLPFGTVLTEEILYKYDEQGYSGLLVNLDETSTGQLYNIDMLSSFCKKNNMLLIVDGISAFLADSIDMAKMGVDLLIFSSQKSLALAPGLSIIILSERIYEQRIKCNAPKSLYFDFNSYIENIKRGQTPFTPAVRVIIEMLDMLKQIENTGGVDARVEYTKKIALDFRKRIKETRLTVPDYPLSNALTPLYFPNNNAKTVYNTLKEKYDVFVTPNGGSLADSVLRVGHLGNHTIDDNIMLTELLSKII